MANLEIYNSSATAPDLFVDFVNNVISETDRIALSTSSQSGYSRTSIKNKDGNEISSMTVGSAHYSKIYKFNNVSTDPSIVVEGGTTSTGFYLFIVPICELSDYYCALYSSDDHMYSAYEATGDETIFSNFRILKYVTDDKLFLSFGTQTDSITISEHVFKQFDDPANTKTILIVTDSDGYVTLYDGYTHLPWVVHPTMYNNLNTGYTNGINAYRYSTKGYYCDNLYYFDGGLVLPGEGVSKMGNNKFLKMGNSNFYIKME